MLPFEQSLTSDRFTGALSLGGGLTTVRAMQRLLDYGVPLPYARGCVAALCGLLGTANDQVIYYALRCLKMWTSDEDHEGTLPLLREIRRAGGHVSARAHGACRPGALGDRHTKALARESEPLNLAAQVVATDGAVASACASETASSCDHVRVASASGGVDVMMREVLSVLSRPSTRAGPQEPATC